MVGFASILDAAAVRNVAAYLDTLPEERSTPTVAGDAARGRTLYRTCAACHGESGEGVWTTQAPRLAQMSDWYLLRQLDNFRQGVRGAHPQDFRGSQMALMARVADERDAADLVAYINTFRAADRMVASNAPP
jgi:cytochrome c oxidase subunit 2